MFGLIRVKLNGVSEVVYLPCEGQLSQAIKNILGVDCLDGVKINTEGKTVENLIVSTVYKQQDESLSLEEKLDKTDEVFAEFVNLTSEEQVMIETLWSESDFDTFEQVMEFIQNGKGYTYYEGVLDKEDLAMHFLKSDGIPEEVIEFVDKEAYADYKLEEMGGEVYWCDLGLLNIWF